MAITVILAHRTRIVRDGLRYLLQQQANLQVLADVSEGSAMLEAVQRSHPRLLLLDHELPSGPVHQAIRLSRRLEPDTGIIMLTIPADSSVISRYLQMGVLGFMGLDYASDELLAAVDQVQQGHIYLSANLARLSMPRPLAVDHRTNGSINSQELTERQREILALLAEGRSTKEIAHDLSISPKPWTPTAKT
ncbi:MAG: response regulator transcription factor [Phycisphaerales bacterium]|nr:response regulator transcription factor [Phycisphaerales bacterium]